MMLLNDFVNWWITYYYHLTCFIFLVLLVMRSKDDIINEGYACNWGLPPDKHIVATSYSNRIVNPDPIDNE
ncbi:hypothetical protein L6452_32416 [Arctium lappa]|uniref:Uncharacterized protein n=1 Tax=Arctium lappa TaxID=4217 RepID=A0ACB8Z493_ARCLA|nr:hypothetical protein L6452_32416 [Arctium lappa]